MLIRVRDRDIGKEKWNNETVIQLDKDRLNKIIYCINYKLNIFIKSFKFLINKFIVKKISLILTIFILSFFYLIIIVNAGLPEGPIVSSIKNETRQPLDATLINTSGGSITTMVLNTTAQNMKWKAFVGNVSGTLVLSDASNYSIYDWSMSTVAGNVYATRKSNTVSWNNINCANLTHIYNEEVALYHTSNPDDNISRTFNTKDHDQFYVATKQINANSCYSLRTNVNGQKQSGTRYFEEIVLYDGTLHNNGYIVYATRLEKDVIGYNNKPYDFQMIVPEVALASWTSSTGYYFYVELT